MGEVNVPVVLVVTDHVEHLRHGVVATFNAAVFVRVVGAGREFVCAE